MAETVIARVNGAAPADARHDVALATFGVQETVGFGLRTVRRPDDVLADAQVAAARLKDVVVQTGAVTIIHGREHLCVEAWLTLGTFFGVTAGVRRTEFIEIAGESGFVAHAEAVLIATGRVLSGADGMCMTDEPHWKERPKYEERGGQLVCVRMEPVPHQQRRSMAQTRALSKVLANVLRWVVVLAGYSPTPAEEMDSAVPPAVGAGRERQRNAGRGGEGDQPAAGPSPDKAGTKKGREPGEPVITEKRAGLLWARFKASGKSRAELGKLLGSQPEDVWTAVKRVKVKDFERLLAALGGAGK